MTKKTLPLLDNFGKEISWSFTHSVRLLNVRNKRDANNGFERDHHLMITCFPSRLHPLHLYFHITKELADDYKSFNESVRDVGGQQTPCSR